MLQCDRMVGSEADHGIGADLLHGGLHLRKGREHAAIELDVIARTEIGHGVLAEGRTKYEGVAAVSAAERVVAGADAQAVVAIAAVEQVVAISNAHDVIAVSTEDLIVA